MALTPSTCHALTTAYYPLLGEAMCLHDSDNGYPLLCVLDAMLCPLQPVWDLVTDTTGTGGLTLPGWAQAANPATLPSALLPWLGQMVGYTVDASLTDAVNRANISGLARWHRGQASVVAAVAASRLPVGSRVDYLERDPDANTLHVIVYPSQSTTAQRATAKAALLRALPAHITLLWEERAGETYAQIRAHVTAPGQPDTYAGLTTVFPHYSDSTNFAG